MKMGTSIFFTSSNRIDSAKLKVMKLFANKTQHNTEML